MVDGQMHGSLFIVVRVKLAFDCILILLFCVGRSRKRKPKCASSATDEAGDGPGDWDA